MACSPSRVWKRQRNTSTRDRNVAGPEGPGPVKARISFISEFRGPWQLESVFQTSVYVILHVPPKVFKSRDTQPLIIWSSDLKARVLIVAGLVEWRSHFATRDGGFIICRNKYHPQKCAPPPQ